MLDQWWASVYDAGTTLTQHWVNAGKEGTAGAHIIAHHDNQFIDEDYVDYEERKIFPKL